MRPTVSSARCRQSSAVSVLCPAFPMTSMRSSTRDPQSSTAPKYQISGSSGSYCELESTCSLQPTVRFGSNTFYDVPRCCLRSWEPLLQTPTYRLLVWICTASLWPLQSKDVVVWMRAQTISSTSSRASFFTESAKFQRTPRCSSSSRASADFADCFAPAWTGNVSP